MQWLITFLVVMVLIALPGHLLYKLIHCGPDTKNNNYLEIRG